MSVKSLAPAINLSGPLVNLAPPDLLRLAMQAPASKRTRVDEPEGKTPVGRWRRMTLRFFMAMNQLLEQTLMYKAGILNPRGLVTNQVCNMTLSLDNEALLQVQDHIDQVLKERGLAKEIEDDQASMKSMQSMASTTTNSFVVVNDTGASGSGSANPRCECDLTTVVLQTHKQGRNFQRQFFRCPKWKNPAQRCNFFQWLDRQPLWRDSSSPPTPERMPEKEGQFLRPANVDIRQKSTFYANPAHCEHRIITGAGTNAYQIQRKCSTCMKLLFQKDKRTGNILFHDPGYLVPKFQQKELLGIDPSDSDGFSGFTTPENVSSSELKSTSSAQSSPPRPKRTKAKNPEKHVKEMWEMEAEETDYQEFLQWRRFQEFKKMEKDGTTSSGRRG